MDAHVKRFRFLPSRRKRKYTALVADRSRPFRQGFDKLGLSQHISISIDA